MTEDIPPCNIRIDKDGNWYYRGAPMIRKDIYLFFNRHIEKDPNGRYLLHIDDQKCYLEVEDTPFVIKRVDRVDDFKVLLNDATQEALSLDTLWVGRNSVLYCKVKDKRFDARFGRAPYYQLAKYIEYDKKKDKYFVLSNEKQYYIEPGDS